MSEWEREMVVQEDKLRRVVVRSIAKSCFIGHESWFTSQTTITRLWELEHEGGLIEA